MAERDDTSVRRRRPQDWTSDEKLRVVMEAAWVPEAELGAFLRREGLHEAQLEEWRSTVMTAAREALDGGSGGGSSKKEAKAEAKRIRDLERELRRKERALAEAAALLVLKKKVAAIWGDEDDATETERGR